MWLATSTIAGMNTHIGSRKVWTYLNSRLSALAASLAFSSLDETLSQTSNTRDQSSEEVANRKPASATRRIDI